MVRCCAFLGTLQRPLVWVSSLISSSSQSYGLVRYTALGLLLALMVLYLVCESVEAKKVGFKVWVKGGWSIFLLFHLMVLIGLLASFAAVQIIAVLAPNIVSTVRANGYYAITESPTATDETSFFQLVSSYGGLFNTNEVAQQACIVFGSLSGITGCVLTARLIPATAGLETTSLQMTFRKVKYYLLACILAMLAIALIFVSLGNICFGATTGSFAGYYERQVANTLSPTPPWTFPSLLKWSAVGPFIGIRLTDLLRQSGPVGLQKH